MCLQLLSSSAGLVIGRLSTTLLRSSQRICVICLEGTIWNPPSDAKRGCLWLHGCTVLPMFLLLLEDSPSFWLTFLNVYLYICQLFELVFQLFWPSAGRKLWDYVTVFGTSNHIGLELKENLKISKSNSFIHMFTTLLHCLVCDSPVLGVGGADSWHLYSSREDGHENRLNKVMQVPW